MQLKKTKNLNSQEANAYIQEIQHAVNDLLTNIANEQVNDIQRAIDYRDDGICGSVFEDYEVIRKLKIFTGLTIEV